MSGATLVTNAMTPTDGIPVRLSIVSPAHNEAENVERLIEEVGRAGEAVLALVEGGGAFEFILVDDGSTDATRAIAQRLMPLTCPAELGPV